jgi:hypothetical protein
MRIYLDNCCFNRPFDDQSQIRIRLEAESKLFIQQKVLEKKIELVWSYILDYENSVNPFIEKKMSIARWKKNAISHVLESKAILRQAMDLEAMGIKAKDSLHIACAIEADCDDFLTTDDILINRLVGFDRLRVINPVSFASFWEDEV